MELRDYLLSRYGQKIRQVSKKSPSMHKHVAVVLDRKLNLINLDYNRGALHAEAAAVDKFLRAYLPRGRKAYMVFVARIISSGFAISKPCNACQSLLDSLSLKSEYTVAGMNPHAQKYRAR